MDMTIDQQVALDEALVPHASRLRIRKSNFHLRSDITSNESTLQLVYDVLRLTPFYKAFLVTSDVPEIYMQEFWVTATVHHHSIHFKMDNKKCIVNLKYFREMLHLCLRFLNQTFDELPFEEEILAFIRYLGHSGKIRKLTDAQILWGMYHKKNVDFAYLLWEDFVYQVEHKDAKKSNEMYYPRFTKVIIHFFMTKDPSIPRRNKFDVMLPVELTNEDISNSKAYKEYYAIASGVAPPKTKASVRKTKSSSNTTITPPTVVAMTEAEQIKLAAKRSLQQTHISQASGSGVDEGTGIILGVPDAPIDEFDEEISWKSSDEDDDDEVDEKSNDQEDKDDQDDDHDDDDQCDNDDDQDTNNDGDDFVHPKLSIHEEEDKHEESFAPIVQTPESSDDEGNDDASLGLNVGSEEGQDAEDDDEELYRDVNINLEGRDVQMIDVHTTQEFEDIHVTLTPVNPDGQQQSSSVSSQFVTSMLNPIPDAGIDSLFESTPRVDVQASTTVAPIILTAPTLPPPTIPTISQIIKDQVKEQVKVQVSKILPKIEKTVNEQLKAKVLTRSSNSSKTSYVVVADLSEMELKKILTEKMESNKSIHRSDEQRNLYKALVDAYECDKIIPNTYGDTVTLKKRHNDADKDEEPSTGSDRGLRDEEKEKSQSQQALQRKRLPRPLASLLKDTLTPELLAGSTYELMKGSCKSLIELEFFLEEVYKATTDQLDWNNPEG
nr:hypothetical protein [Tanacetum cinerariifolium]